MLQKNKKSVIMKLLKIDAYSKFLFKKENSMKKLCFLMALLTVLLCSCLQGDFQNPVSQSTEETTAEYTTPEEVTTPEVTTSEEVTTPEVTTPEETTPEETTPEETRHEHLFVERVVTKEPTCGAAGEAIVTCACGETQIEIIYASIAHSYNREVVKDATCAESGQEILICSGCGDRQEAIIPATGKHVYGDAVVTKAPTCGENGEAVSTCSICGAECIDVLAASGEHTYTVAIAMQPPTCVNEGFGISFCSVCRHSKNGAIPATGKHVYGEAVITKEATCFEDGEKTAKCATCTKTEKTVIPAWGEHIYENGICPGCGDEPVTLYPVPSVYDADGDGEPDIYNFSPELIDVFQNGIHVWAGDYIPGSNASVSSAQGIQHWYVTENQKPSQFILYSVTVPETGEYEMVVHLRMKDAQERGSKYTINAGTEYEYSFETSYGHTGLDYAELRNANTHGTYMYGIKVNLVAGENIIKIEQSSNSPKCQHYRDFYFVKTGEFHAHTYNETVITPATCSTDGEKVGTCSCGLTKTFIIPATQNHVYVEDVCTGCGKVYVPAGITEYNFLYDTPGFAGGTFTFLPETTDVYTFYWADANGKLKDYTMLYSDEFVANVEAEVTIQSFTAIPKGATRLMVFSGDGDVVYSYTIPQERLFVEEELYVFGALSDTHQGSRYGSTTIPYNHFINAAEILYEKGAIAIGICGDFSYENIESEYVLHSEAIQQIYAFAPEMPIFTTTGNHESKYTGFSYDWYMQYARDVVDYDSELDYVYFDGNELDYVVELPDGSVMIYLHQIAYDYGKSTSRLLYDSQLEWFEARLEQYKDTTVFFFFHTFMDEEVGDASVATNEYGLPMISSTVEYKKFTELFAKYTNVVYFSGHSHWTFDAQFEEPKAGKTNYDKNIDDKDGTFATMVHIPACSTPRVVTGGQRSNASEGYIVHVYENYVVFEGYEFVQGETVAYATYIIEK